MMYEWLRRRTGELAQMAERSLCMREVEGSMPSFSICCFLTRKTVMAAWSSGMILALGASGPGVCLLRSLPKKHKTPF